MTLCFTGDLYLGNSKTPQLEWGTQFSALWNKADFRIINFEAPVIDATFQPIKKAAPVLGHAEQAVWKLKDMGVDYWGLANNHMGDFGIKGIANTIRVIGQKHVLGAHVDLEQACHNPYEARILSKDRVSVALFCLAEGEPGISTRPGILSPIAWVGNPLLYKKIAEVRNQVDSIIILVHAGIEDILLPLPEWRNVYKRLIDYGANAVIAHHPHAPQGYEWIDGALIAYSLGNCWMAINASEPWWRIGIMGSLCVEKNGTMRWTPWMIEGNEGLVELMQAEKAETILKNLNQLLEKERYTLEWEQLEKELWETRYKNFAEDSVNYFSPQRPFSRAWWAVAKKLKMRPKINEKLLYHNLHVDSHRWFFERILEKTLTQELP